MKRAIILISLEIGVIVLGGCSQYGSTPNNSSGGNKVSAPVQTPAPTQGSSVTSNSINIQNFAFSPATLTVKKGTTVTWTNNDSAPHQIKSATFNSGQLGNGQSFSFAFDTAGTFDYSCAIHPSMLGKIIVQ